MRGARARPRPPPSRQQQQQDRNGKGGKGSTTATGTGTRGHNNRTGDHLSSVNSQDLSDRSRQEKSNNFNSQSPPRQFEATRIKLRRLSNKASKPKNLQTSQTAKPLGVAFWLAWGHFGGPKLSFENGGHCQPAIACHRLVLIGFGGPKAATANRPKTIFLAGRHNHW